MTGPQARRDPRLPPAWPAQVRPPGTPEWERSAISWLLDLCPADYRSYDVLRRHPLVLARFAAGHVQAGVAAAREGLRTARADLHDVVGPEVVEAALAAYDREGRRLVAAGRSVEAITAALRGEAWVPRL